MTVVLSFFIGYSHIILCFQLKSILLLLFVNNLNEPGSFVNTKTHHLSPHAKYTTVHDAVLLSIQNYGDELNCFYKPVIFIISL